MCICMFSCFRFPAPRFPEKPSPAHCPGAVVRQARSRLLLSARLVAGTPWAAHAAAKAAPERRAPTKTTWTKWTGFWDRACQAMSGSAR